MGDKGAEVFAFFFANNGIVTNLTIEGACMPKGENTYLTAHGFAAIDECLLRDTRLKTITITGIERDFYFDISSTNLQVTNLRKVLGK